MPEACPLFPSLPPPCTTPGASTSCPLLASLLSLFAARFSLFAVRLSFSCAPRYIYLVSAAAQLLSAAAAAAAAAVRSLHDALRDEMYLVGRRLVNYERPQAR